MALGDNTTSVARGVGARGRQPYMIQADLNFATAEQINKTETYRDPDSFADIVRGMHLYGRKILRPEAIVTAKYNAA